MVDSDFKQADPREELRDIIQTGLSEDLFYLEEAMSLEDFISEHSEAINTATFGAFFGCLQVILGRYIILQTAKLFDYPCKKFKKRSIYTAICTLNIYKDQLKIEQPIILERKAKEYGLGIEISGSVSNPQLTTALAAYFENQLGSEKNQNRLYFAVENIKTLRNKKIAHPEMISDAELPPTTFGDIKLIIDFAKQFVATIGIAYLSIIYDDDSGDYFLTSDAQRAKRCLKRILTAANAL